LIFNAINGSEFCVLGYMERCKGCCGTILKSILTNASIPVKFLMFSFLITKLLRIITS